ncbi:FR47-like protein [Seminavis robusta]|uniref:FR47-like protein n=1 Tax=Seminavis robusta TaxID=568900 RepID=A0A9N8HYE0_9STRA|nr:FR47-like protein [Seminavis robusta]|eukprot:Sro2463_g328400.1 FR47-like protein (389) ;mRNA; r:3383-4549
MLLSQKAQGFVPTTSFTRPTSTKKSVLRLIPLTQFGDELSFFSPAFDKKRCCISRDGKFTTGNDDEEPFELFIVEENDLPEVALFIVKAFGADAINLISNEFSAFEKRLIEPAMDFFNGYTAVTAFTEVLWGLRIRQADRVVLSSVKEILASSEEEKEQAIAAKVPVTNDISPPQLPEDMTYKEKVEACNRKSLVLVLARPSVSNDNSSSKWESVESNIDIIASVELRLQVSLLRGWHLFGGSDICVHCGCSKMIPLTTIRHANMPMEKPCDAKIPFSLPWWDEIERNAASFLGIPKDKSSNHLQPYLSTLCVDETYRGKQIGRAIVRCLEDIATTKWGYSKMYLHVDGENPPALNLYKSEGYEDVGRRWNPFWAGKAADIGYFVKNM